ncbi:MAG: hypothetical protein C0P77_005245 [Thermoanaerobacterales bacterium]|jgi:hypothetical protein|nr:hypothetical protein [Thermoanaerobacterales bacterium]
MSIATEPRAEKNGRPPVQMPDIEVIRLPRRTIDKLLTSFGVVAMVVFAVAGGLLTWGADFANDYVHDELSTQRIFFPDEESLREEGRDDLVKYAGEQVDTGEEAEAYASYINGHLEEIADGKRYAEIDDRGAQAAVEEAIEAGAPADEVAELQARADELKRQRDTLFRGETLRGLLLSSFAWSTVGRIAGIAAWVAFAGAAIMAVLVVLGVIHMKRTKHA